MIKVAYLIGVSGSGKSTIVGTLDAHVDVVKVDKVRDKAKSRLCANECEQSDAWEFWNHCKCDLPNTLSLVLKDMYPHMSNCRPLLAEGFDLGCDQFRRAFREALTSRAITISDELAVWIDPPDEVVLKYRKCRCRKLQTKETLKDVRDHCDWYRERVSQEYCCRYEDAEDANQALRAFLL